MGSWVDRVQPGDSEGGDEPGPARLRQAGQGALWRVEPPVLPFCNTEFTLSK